MPIKDITKQYKKSHPNSMVHGIHEVSVEKKKTALKKAKIEDRRGETKAQMAENSSSNVSQSKLRRMGKHGSIGINE